MLPHLPRRFMLLWAFRWPSVALSTLSSTALTREIESTLEWMRSRKCSRSRLIAPIQAKIVPALIRLPRMVLMIRRGARLTETMERRNGLIWMTMTRNLCFPGSELLQMSENNVEHAMRKNLRRLVDKQSVSWALQDLSLCTVPYASDFPCMIARFVTRRFKVATAATTYLSLCYRANFRVRLILDCPPLAFMYSVLLNWLKQGDWFNQFSGIFPVRFHSGKVDLHFYPLPSSCTLFGALLLVVFHFLPTSAASPLPNSCENVKSRRKNVKKVKTSVTRTLS